MGLAQKTVRRNTFTALIVGLSVLASWPARADGLDPSLVYIHSVTYGGSGCPQGSVSTSLSEDRESFTLLFAEYVASVGPDVPLTESRKSCQLNITLHFPPGWQYTIVALDYRGYVQLPRGWMAGQQSTYYFQGEVILVNSDVRFVGPVSKDYHAHDEAPLVWSGCGTGRSLNVNSRIQFFSSDSRQQGQITLDSLDGKVRNQFQILWAPC